MVHASLLLSCHCLADWYLNMSTSWKLFSFQAHWVVMRCCILFVFSVVPMQESNSGMKKLEEDLASASKVSWLFSCSSLIGLLAMEKPGESLTS